MPSHEHNNVKIVAKWKVMEGSFFVVYKKGKALGESLNRNLCITLILSF